ncbi:MAG: type I restriction-modification system subunit M [Synergistaceae bacterium]|jgi:type I restriction enzyme M protein|nr:type I restriction-modification system subunit M [Synergistaceae bacterium]
MAIKKSELYSSLWASCDELRGSMDASQYKDYVLVMLFIKYISDRYANVPYAPIKIPTGATFQDMVALKGNPNIGDLINKRIIEPIAEANKLSEMPDFANPDKLGSGPEMVKKLSNLIAIFENPALDFRGNRAEGDDILGDAYEYLMRHFATESGKSKGQFYTPAEVSRIMAKVIGINSQNTTSETSVYDPTCGSGSLLLKVADEAEKLVSVFGQENDSATAGLARMNMILHNNPTAVIKQGNTLSNPLFKDQHNRLQTFNYIVANPPFSFKSWSNGVNVAQECEDGGRFYGYGVPPAKNGDYAFLLHMIKSLKSNGKAAVILPHGVLFRGNAEAEIRKNLIKSGMIKGIIGLPANLFYGTGIPACLIVLDKENREARKGIFMMDAGKGFMKDGNKNRLREQDIHKIVDTFNKFDESNPKFARMVSLAEIEEKEFNLNIPRYIDSTEPEDIQNIEAHLLGDIPNADIEALQDYWTVYPSLKNHLFGKSKRDNFSALKVTKDEIKQSIFSHPEFVAYTETVNSVFNQWKIKNTPVCKAIDANTKPKKFIHTLSEDLLHAFGNLQLIDKYDVYQHLLTYWMDTMQDDVYLIVSDTWKAGNEVEWTKKEFEGKLIPKLLMINRYFATEQKAIEQLEADRDAIAAQIEELEEEYSGENGFFADLEKVNKANVNTELKTVKEELKADKTNAELLEKKKVFELYLKLCDDLTEANKKLKEAKAELDKKLLAKYPTLTETEIKELVVSDKWITTIEHTVKNEMQRISQRLTSRIKELAERYESPMPTLLNEVSQWEQKVNAHLAKMGFTWK